MKIISASEKVIVGGWLNNKVEVLADENSKRINWLISNKLNKVGVDESGWEVLYQDPKDKRYWALSYPQSEIHGGGPPTLNLVSENEAKSKFGGIDNT